MDNTAVVIMAVVSVLAITGLVLYNPSVDGAAISKPLIGDQCMRMACGEGLAPALLKEYDGYVFCACGTYYAGTPPEKVFEYDAKDGKWIQG